MSAIVVRLPHDWRGLHVGRELAQSLVKVVHLGKDTNHSNNHEDISRRVAELVVPRKGQLESNAKRLDGHDRDGSNSRANAQVDKRILLAVDRPNLVDHNRRENADEQRVEQEAYTWSATSSWSMSRQPMLVHTWLNRIFENLVNSLNILVRGCMQHNNDSSDQTEGAPQLAQRPQLLIEHV